MYLKGRYINNRGITNLLANCYFLDSGCIPLNTNRSRFQRFQQQFFIFITLVEYLQCKFAITTINKLKSRKTF